MLGHGSKNLVKVGLPNPRFGARLEELSKGGIDDSRVPEAWRQLGMRPLEGTGNLGMARTRGSGEPSKGGIRNLGK